MPPLPKAPPSDEELLERSRMTLGEHLEELRRRLIRSAVALAATFALAWGFYEELGALVLRPYGQAVRWLEEHRVELYQQRVAEEEAALRAGGIDPEALPGVARPGEGAGVERAPWTQYFRTPTPSGPDDLLERHRLPPSPKTDGAGVGFFFYMRVCFAFALFVGGPLVLWQMWQFIAAGLYNSEKRVVHAYFPLSVGLFLGGVTFGFLVMVPNAIFFLVKMSMEQLFYWESMDSYWTFLTSLTLALGAIFQLPVLMLVLARLDIVQPSTFSKYRGHCIVGALIVSAFLTPPDPITQMLMAGPVIVLYEVGHLLARIAARRAAARSDPATA